MVNLSRRLSCVLICCLFAGLLLPAAVPCWAAPIRVLFLGGGSTSHDPAAMRDVIKPVFEKAGMAVEYRANESILHADSLARFDALFVYNAKKGSKTDGTPDLTKAQEDALFAWIESGHAMITAHGATSSYLENPRWAQLIGGSYTVHGNDFKYVTIAKPEHGSMTGVAPPTGWDEGRQHKLLREDLIILATLNVEKTPWTWVHPQGKGWVYYTSSGHDTRTWGDTGFQGQLVQAVKWGFAASGGSTAAAQPLGGVGQVKRAWRPTGRFGSESRNALGRSATISAAAGRKP